MQLINSTAPITSPIRADVQAMQRYSVQAAQGFIKLDAMENPYSLPEAVQTQLAQHLAGVALNRYPTDHGAAIAAIRHAQAIPESYDLMLGNGSDELLHLLIQAVAQGQGASATVVMAPTPSFVMYGLSAQLNQCRFVGVPLQANFELDLVALLAGIAQHQPAILFLSYPNNPTGNAWQVADIQACITAMQVHGGLVVIDEAYRPFAANSWLSCLADAPNVVLVQTLSKLGLAGLRLGYLVAAPHWIEQLDKVRPPYNINVLTLAATTWLLSKHATVFKEQALQIMAQRALLFKALQQLPHVTPYLSEANFILVKVPDASAWFTALKAQGILVKNATAMSPLLDNCLRLTVGSAAENLALIAALEGLAKA